MKALIDFNTEQKAIIIPLFHEMNKKQKALTKNIILRVTNYLCVFHANVARVPRFDFNYHTIFLARSQNVVAM
jgi:NADH:ubiquinone oxidoreductase subunit E